MVTKSNQKVPKIASVGSEKFFTDGDAYERFMGRWSQAAGEVFIDWLSLPKELRWVDVGCGTGAFTELVLDLCAPKQISAIDPAEDQVAYACSKPTATRVSYRLGDAQSLPYADDTFDVAAMALVITFVPDPAKAVTEMVRVVRPGGSVATYIWDVQGEGPPFQPLINALEAMNVNVPFLAGAENARLDTLNDFFETAGLAEVATRKIEIEVSYADFDDFWTSQTVLGHPVVKTIQTMAKPDVEQLKAYLREWLPTDQDGRIAYQAWANAVKGRVPG